MTENGWPPDTNRFPGVPLPFDQMDTNPIPGTDESIPLQRGIPNTILKAFAADLNWYVESVYNVRGGLDEGGWTPTNSVATSNHLGGTAVDYNWSDHPMGNAYAGWDWSQIAGNNEIPRVRELLAYYTYEDLQLVWWANDWDSPKDSMHFQMGYGTFERRDVCDRFIAERIRPDGFSRFKETKGDAPSVDRVAVLADAMGNRDGVDYAPKLAAVTQCLNECGCTTVDRIAMWMGQVGEESGGLQWMEEIASGAEYEGRGDLGNNQPGDGRRFKGRGPIQVTGRHNYTVLSQWAYSQGLVPSPTFFVDNPEQLASDQYGFIGVTWYWTTQRPMNDAADARDIVRATKYVNGGTNGLQDRTDRWNHCLSMGDRLLTLLNQGDDDEMGAVDGPSVSIYRTDDNSIGVCNPVTRANNAMLHEAHVEALAEAGLPWEAGLLAALEAGHLPASNQPGAADRARFLLDHKVPADVASAARQAAAS